VRERGEQTGARAGPPLPVAVDDRDLVDPVQDEQTAAGAEQGGEGRRVQAPPGPFGKPLTQDSAQGGRGQVVAAGRQGQRGPEVPQRDQDRQALAQWGGEGLAVGVRLGDGVGGQCAAGRDQGEPAAEGRFAGAGVAGTIERLLAQTVQQQFVLRPVVRPPVRRARVRRRRGVPGGRDGGDIDLAELGGVLRLGLQTQEFDRFVLAAQPVEIGGGREGGRMKDEG